MGPLSRALSVAGIAAVVANLASGCGTMIGEHPAIVSVSSNPPGARLFLDGVYAGNAPTNLPLETNVGHTVEAEAPGYERKSVRVDSGVHAGYVVMDCLWLIAVVVPGIVALVVDTGTGGWRTLDTSSIVFNMRPKESAAPFAMPPAPTAQPVAPANAAPAPANAAPAGCQYDTQCKGDRICRGGQCVSPSGAP
jgi:hypothetical protein